MVLEEKKLKPRTFNLYFSLMKIATLISTLYKFFFLFKSKSLCHDNVQQKAINDN